MTRESSIEQACRRHSESRGWLLLKLFPLVAGIPDRVLLRPGGRVDFVEFKAPGRPLQKIQRFWAARLEGLGFRCWRIDSTADFRETFDVK